MTNYLGWVDRFLFAGLLLLFFLSPLPLGSDRGWAYLALSGVYLMLLAAHLFFQVLNGFCTDRFMQKPRIDPGTYLLLFVALWMFIQATFPLPFSWLSLLSPGAADLYSSAFKVLHVDIDSSSFIISLDYAQTLNRALLALACFSLVFLMGQLIRSQKRLLLFCYVVVLSGVFQAVYGTLMTLTGVEYLLFIPKDAYIGNATGTFVNRNSLAGYLEMTLSVGIGLLLGMRKDRIEGTLRWRGIVRLVAQTLLSQVAIVRCFLIVMVIGLLMTHSRMGNAAFFNALLFTGAVSLFASKRFRNPGFYAILLSIILVDIFLLGSLFDLDKVMDRLEKTGLDTETRDEVVHSALKMIPDYWLTGSGAGTFAYVFPQYIQQYLGMFYDYAHNDYLQIFLEVGLIGMIPLALYIGLALSKGWTLLRRGHTSMARGMGFSAVMATVSLLIHSTVDFNLQIPANVLLFVAVLALPTIALRISEPQKNRS